MALEVGSGLDRFRFLIEDVQAWCNRLDMVMCIGISCWLDRLMENGA